VKQKNDKGIVANNNIFVGLGTTIVQGIIFGTLKNSKFNRIRLLNYKIRK
jgi:hypothetical protein